MLVLERTDFVAKVYLVDIAGATDLRSWTPPAGKPLNYLESLNADGALEGAGREVRLAAGVDATFKSLRRLVQCQ